MDRRNFLKNSSAIVAGTFLLPHCSPTSGSAPAIGLQLYTVRDQMSADAVGTLKQIAAIGYNQVETAGYSEGSFYGLSAADFLAVTRDLGLRVVSSHLPVNVLQDDFERALEAVIATGQQYIVLPWLSPEQRNMEFYKQVADLLNRRGEACKDAGITLAYHNHDFEFVPIDGVKPMDLLISETDKDLVQFELDLYWVYKAGEDPLTIFQNHPGRFPLWHVKDMADTPEKGFAEVGTGTIDFAPIFAQAGVAGMKHFFVEQDQSDDPMKSIGISYKNVKKLLA